MIRRSLALLLLALLFVGPAGAANDLTGQVWIIDTASATALSTTVTGTLSGVRWVGATTAAHAATIQDGQGRVLWSSVANAANYVEADAPGLSFRGLIVPTLGSGTLYLDFK